jgi:hypothetical protein
VIRVRSLKLTKLTSAFTQSAGIQSVRQAA